MSEAIGNFIAICVLVLGCTFLGFFAGIQIGFIAGGVKVTVGEFHCLLSQSKSLSFYS